MGDFNGQSSNAQLDKLASVVDDVVDKTGTPAVDMFVLWHDVNTIKALTKSAFLTALGAGSANGVAELDGAGLVPSGQLPSFVDDVLEFADFASLPGTGESGKIYVTLDNNKTFRWSGSAYVEISASLSLGETSSTAYRGDRGKIAFDHTGLSDNPHSVTAAQVGALVALIGDTTPDLGGPLNGKKQTAHNLTGKIAAAVTHSASGPLVVPHLDGVTLEVTVSAAITSFDVSDWPTVGLQSMKLRITNGGSAAITWSDGTNPIKATDGTAPALQASGVDEVILIRQDTGPLTAIHTIRAEADIA